MPLLKFEGQNVLAREGENVLDAFMRHGITIPFSCRNGSCHVCMQQGKYGAIPPVAQRGLRPELCKEGYFLACQCIPLGDMEIAPPTALYFPTLVHSKEMLSPNVCRLLIEPTPEFNYLAGQFISLRRHDGLTRSYSLAGLPQDYFLELHVQRKNGGSMSNWILDELQAGDEISIQGPDGHCHYQHEAHNHPLLMVATGTGLAPLLGILREALQQQHTADIHLYHGSRLPAGLYLDAPLRELEKRHANFHYHPCVSGHPAPQGMHAGRTHDVAFAAHKDLRGHHVYLAGLAEMVSCAEQLAAERGASPHAIHSDAFVLRDLRKKKRDGKPAAPPPVNGNKAKYPPPDPELWAALREGELLTLVLTDFYGRVYSDDRLASFFEGVTKQRLIEKQFLFTRQILTGERIYFGDQPRNTHHWMVISEDLFDYRSALMLACLRGAGLSELMVQRFLAIEEYYREDIVKTAPFPKLIGDTEMPLEGFNELVMDIGTLCDSCQREVHAGEKVIYHVRLGKIYCSDCSQPHTRDESPANG
ncbi:MAG: 2Fe-2S iron-sulfur cluster binding domain-containing protein [Nitrosomonadales bacterium]|nr:2Fe-2S iron-sulfur cluster binding domain-containing protein [Nitrosomonadales bacterium]